MTNIKLTTYNKDVSTLKPHSRANIVTLDIPLEKIFCFLYRKYCDEQKISYKNIDMNLFCEVEFQSSIFHHHSKDFLTFLSNYLPQNIKYGDVIMIKSLYRHNFYFSNPNWKNLYYPRTGIDDLYIFDGKNIVSILDNHSDGGYTGINSLFTIDKLHIDFFDNLGDKHQTRYVNLFPNKNQLIDNLIIHEDYMYAETSCDNYTIILFLENKSVDVFSMKKYIMDFMNSIDDKNIWVLQGKQIHGFTSFNKTIGYYTYEQSQYYFSTMKYSKDNVGFIPIK